MSLTHRLRLAGVSTDRAFDARSMKAQMKAAAKSGARFALIVGEDERAGDVVTVRDLDKAEQSTIGHGDVVDHLRKALES